MAKKLKESYLNIKTIPSQTISSCDDSWCISDIEDDEYNVGIEANVAPMVGSQGGKPLSTIGDDCCSDENNNIDYYMQMAGINDLAVEPEVPASIEQTEPVQDDDFKQTYDIYNIEVPEDLYGDMNNDMSVSDYNDIIVNSRFPSEEPVELFTDDSEEEVEEPNSEVVDVQDDQEVIEVPEESNSDPYDGIVGEEKDVRNYVTEEDKPADDSERQPLIDYLVHNKEIIYGANSSKIEQYKKDLASKSLQELKDEAEELSPNWKKYIEKYRINESVEKKPFNIVDFFEGYSVSDLNLFDSGFGFVLSTLKTAYVVECEVVGSDINVDVKEYSEDDELKPIYNGMVSLKDIASLIPQDWFNKIADKLSYNEAFVNQCACLGLISEEKAKQYGVEVNCEDKLNENKKRCEKLKESEEMQFADEVAKIADNADFEVVKIDDVDDGYVSVLVSDKNSNFEAWMDVSVNNNDIDIDWNGYIFNTYMDSDKFQKACQENDLIFELASSAAVKALEEKGILVQNDDSTWSWADKKLDNGYDDPDMLRLAGIQDELEKEIPEDEELLTEDGEELSDEEIDELEDVELEECVDSNGKKAFKFTISSKPSKLKESVSFDKSATDFVLKEINDKVSEENTLDSENINIAIEKYIDENNKKFSSEDEKEEYINSVYDKVVDELVRSDILVESKVNNVDIKVKECDCANKKVDLNHKIPENEMIKDTIDTGETPKYDCECEGKDCDRIYSVKTVDGLVESIKSTKDFKAYLIENAEKIDSVVII